MRVKVEGHIDLVRDTDSLAIINSNSNEFEVYKKRKQALKKQQTANDRIKILEDTVAELISIIDEMRNK